MWYSQLNGYSVRPYRFTSSEAKDRFLGGTNRPTGELVLWDLFNLAREEKCSLPKSIEPRSVYRPEMLDQPLEKFFSGGNMQSYDGKALHTAFRRVARAFYVGKLKPVALERVAYKANTSAGAPLFLKKGECYRESLNEAKAIRNGMAPPPATVYHRGKNTKVARPVFGYPFSMTLLESRFFEPYQFEVIGHHSPYVGGRSYATVGSEINELRWKSGLIYMLDYSGFDGSISQKLLNMALDVLESNFDLSDPVDARDWRLVRRYFVCTPVLLPDGNMLIGKRHGVPSGSMLTQLIDSIVNAIAIEYLKARLHFQTSRYYVMGDDSLIGVSVGGPKLKELEGCLKELGLTLNVEKSRVGEASSPKMHFLGHYWYQGVLTREIEETWGKILTPERWSQDLWSKTEQVRRDALVDRLRAYQDDNSAAWPEIQRVLNRITGRRVDKSILDFRPGLALREREWDPNVQQILVSTRFGRKRYMRPLYACA